MSLATLMILLSALSVFAVIGIGVIIVLIYLKINSISKNSDNLTRDKKKAPNEKQ